MCVSMCNLVVNGNKGLRSRLITCPSGSATQNLPCVSNLRSVTNKKTNFFRFLTRLIKHFSLRFHHDHTFCSLSVLLLLLLLHYFFIFIFYSINIVIIILLLRVCYLYERIFYYPMPMLGLDVVLLLP